MFLLCLLLLIEPRLDLLQFEQQLLSTHKPVAPTTERFGADPFRIASLPDSSNLLVLMRGTDEIWTLDAQFNRLAKQPTPTGAIAWVTSSTHLYVVGERSDQIATYEFGKNGLEKVNFVEIPALVSARDLVYDAKYHALLITDFFEHQLLRVSLNTDGTPKPKAKVYPTGKGPNQLHISGNKLLLNLMWEHELQLIPMVQGEPDFSQAITARNDGNFWSAHYFERQDHSWLLAGGIEDHPLERTGGGFGYVDSFLYLYKLDGDWKKVDQLNLSALGVVTPKLIQPAANSFWVAGYGNDQLLQVQVDTKQGKIHTKQQFTAIPGITDLVDLGMGKLVVTSPLLDRFGVVGTDLQMAPAINKDPRSRESRIGEALLFTTLMAPHNKSDGGYSRFTCEACHFEGEIDGRIHFTGRDDVHATPKTLRGLANSVPFFSSGGDDSLTKMVRAEFRVANQGDPDFKLATKDFSWLSFLGEQPDTLEAEDLRQALLTFFVDFDHKPNPWLIKHGKLDPAAREGLAIFRDRCEDCHQAVATTREFGAVPFEAWDEWLEDPERDMVWAAPYYYKTGITPYFDPGGTQVPSLRRIYNRYPFFSDGRAKSIKDVLQRFRYSNNQVMHDGSLQDGRELSYDEIRKLEALLRYF